MKLWVTFFLFLFINSRWLRLLFGREFPLQDLLVLWDAIFAVGKQFELTNFIVVAMLIRIRNQCKYGHTSLFLKTVRIGEV